MSTEFTIRSYLEEQDFPVFFQNWHNYDSKVTAYQVCGVSPYTPESIIRRKLRDHCRKNHEPFVVADKTSKAIGCSLIGTYIRVAKYRSFSISLWENAELFDQVLMCTLECIFSYSAVKMAVCTVPGYDHHFVDACRKLKMSQVGCIPDYLVYEGSLYPEYTFIMKKNMWQKKKTQKRC